MDCFDTTYGQPIVKDGCGVFGILRKKNSPKISNLAAVSGISCIKYRGSSLGAGFASFYSSDSKRDYVLKAFVRNESTAIELEKLLRSELGETSLIKGVLVSPPDYSSEKPRFGVWQCLISPDVPAARVESVVDKANLFLLSNGRIDGRIFSSGKHVNVYKEVGYPLEVAKMCGLDTEREVADLWIAHTRQPTNSPGSSPIWSHPFASGECAIVHNGDISSFGANVEQLNSWGIKSHVGTDSEVIAKLLDRLVRVEGLSIIEAATVLSNPFERNIPSGSSRTRDLLVKYGGCRLDGPFAVVAGYSTEDDTFLIALTDRSKFRPLMIGEDDSCYYVASEETQIRSLSKNAVVWSPEPGSFFVASVERGILSSATSRDTSVQESILRSELELVRAIGEEASLDATGKSFERINDFMRASFDRGLGHVKISSVSGQRYIGIGLSSKGRRSSQHFKVTIEGFPGNCLANLNDGGIFEIFGNVADDLADTMHSGSVIVHGNARDVCAQALQGGSVFVRGSVGNRAGLQLREYGTRKPYLIIGESADDYLGEYMAGGVIAVLNFGSSDRPVGNYLATGIVGGSVYIRGKVKESQIALLPHREEILNYLLAAKVDGLISERVYKDCLTLEYPSERVLSKLLPESVFSRLRFLYFAGKYNKPISVEYRKLSPQDLGILSNKLAEFSAAFKLSAEKLDEILNSEFTIIRTREEKVETPIPPQEIPVEE